MFSTLLLCQQRERTRFKACGWTIFSAYHLVFWKWTKINLKRLSCLIFTWTSAHLIQLIQHIFQLSKKLAHLLKFFDGEIDCVSRGTQPLIKVLLSRLSSYFLAIRPLSNGDGFQTLKSVLFVLSTPYFYDIILYVETLRVR